jgi:hypothetical protein
MKRHFFGAVGSLTALLLVAGCATDPTGDLRGDVASVVISRNYAELDVGETIRLNAKAYDSQGNALAILPTISVDDETVATITIDTITSGNPLPETDFVVEAISPGQVVITATAGSVTGTTDLISFPTEFSGTVSVAASGFGWDIITVSATANVKFDPAATTATIGGMTAFVHSISADQLELVHSGVDAVTGATVHLDNLVFLGQFATNLDAATSVDVAAIQNYLNEDYDLAAAPDLTAGPFPLHVYGVVSDANPDVIGKIAPASALDLTSSVYWVDSGTDIDVFYTDAGDNFIDCLGCGGDNPETGSWVTAGGDTNYYYVELYSGAPTVFQATLSQTPATVAKR